MPKVQIEPCDKEEIEAILNQAAEDDYYYLLFYLAKTTGRRLGEYVGIPELKVVRTEEYIDSRGQKRIREIKKPTGGIVGGVKVSDINWEEKTMRTMVLKRRQMVYKDALLNDNAIVLLKQYIARHNLKLDDLIFGLKHRTSIQTAIKRYAKLAGIKHNVCFHNFRHYFVTHFLKLGWGYDRVSKLTGHTTPSTLAHYDHTVLADVRKQAEIDMRNI